MGAATAPLLSSILLTCNPEAMSRSMACKCFQVSLYVLCGSRHVISKLSQIQLMFLLVEPHVTMYSSTDQMSVCCMAQFMTVQVDSRTSWVQSLLRVTFSVCEIVAFCVWTYRAFLWLQALNLYDPIHTIIFPKVVWVMWCDVDGKAGPGHEFEGKVIDQSAWLIHYIIFVSLFQIYF
jgi:hypothetical protein